MAPKQIPPDMGEDDEDGDEDEDGGDDEEETGHACAIEKIPQVQLVRPRCKGLNRASACISSDALLLQTPAW